MLNLSRVLATLAVLCAIPTVQAEILISDDWPQNHLSMHEQLHLPLEKDELQRMGNEADAALKACSWGKFQVIGDEHQSSCSISLDVFMKDMCTSEVKQLELLRHFIEHKAGGKLLKAVREKDWDNIARYYNGPGDVAYYSSHLKKTYGKIKKNSA